ncbi:MAG: protease inhibitor I42 family protein [Methyloligellaceae bacterium]
MARALLVTLMTIATLAAPLAASAIAETKTARVGQILLLKFAGNRDAGYVWRLNEAKSSRLDLVTVKDVGWTITGNRRSIFFRYSGVMSISVLPKAPGKATLAFDYVRSWGNRSPVKTEIVRLVIGPAAVAAR